MANENITVTVKFFATLREYGPVKTEIEVPKRSTVKSIIKKYKIPKEVGRLIVLINRRRSAENSILNDGDLVAIFPLIGGG
jgi:molybdopterin synthase sulfur carrier subunit